MAIGTGATLIGAGALGAGGSIFGSLVGSNAASEAAEAQAGATSQATQMQLDFLRETRADIADAVEKGLIDLDTGFQLAIGELSTLGPDRGPDAISAYGDLIRDPSSVMERPGIQFQYGQGLEALQAGFSKRAGGGLSGPMIKSAQEYGQNFAATALDRELARLQPLMELQRVKKTGVSQLYASLGGAKSNLRVGGATGMGQITGSALPGIASTIVRGGEAGASGAINKANVISGAASNIGNTASELAMLYSLKPGLFSGSP